MPSKYSGCFSRKCHHDDEDDASDSADGYFRLETRRVDVNPQDRDRGATIEGNEEDYFKPLNSYQGNTARPKRERRCPETYTEVDIKGKKLSNKLRRKEMRKRIRHFFHSTWKWMKRGFIAVTPNVASMFMLAPSPMHVITTEAVRKQAARSSQTPVSL